MPAPHNTGGMIDHIRSATFHILSPRDFGAIGPRAYRDDPDNINADQRVETMSRSFAVVLVTYLSY